MSSTWSWHACKGLRCSARIANLALTHTHFGLPCARAPPPSQAVRSCLQAIRAPLVGLQQALHDSRTAAAAGTGLHGAAAAAPGPVDTLYDLHLAVLPLSRRAASLMAAVVSSLKPLAMHHAPLTLPPVAPQQQQQRQALGPAPAPPPTSGAGAGAVAVAEPLTPAQLSCALLEQLHTLNERAWLAGSWQVRSQRAPPALGNR